MIIQEVIGIPKLQKLIGVMKLYHMIEAFLCEQRITMGRDASYDLLR
jgi:hypothetical protein